jgi:hypothetical protein
MGILRKTKASVLGNEMTTLLHRGKKLACIIVPSNYTTKIDIGLYRVGPRVGGRQVGSDSNYIG